MEIRSSLVTISLERVETPKLAEMDVEATCVPATACRNRYEAVIAPAAEVPSIKTANSSPP